MVNDNNIFDPIYKVDIYTSVAPVHHATPSVIEIGIDGKKVLQHHEITYIEYSIPTILEERVHMLLNSIIEGYETHCDCIHCQTKRINK